MKSPQQSSSSGTPPAVSVLLPCRNESRHIEECLESIMRMDSPPGGFEVIVADGLSDDGTTEVVERVARRFPGRITLIHNEGRIVSTGLNAAIQAARGRFIVRLDAHTKYAPDYLVQCARIHRETGAANVGGPWIATGRGWIGEAIAIAFASRFSTGGGAAHRPDYAGPVDTVYLGAWDRSIFDRVGLFDEELVRNQDDEFNLRIVRSGGVVWQSPAIRSEYRCRSSFKELFHQFYQYGYWKTRVIQKHRLPASYRHLAPALALVMGMLLIVLAPFVRAAAQTLSAVALAYVLIAATVGIVNSVRTRWTLWPAVAASFPCYHFGYALGFLHGFIDFVCLNRAPSARAITLSRSSS